jgi:adenosylhomocysteine nucleosidase
MKKIITVLIVATVSAKLTYAQAPIFADVAADTATRTYNNITAVVGAFAAEVEILRSQMQQKKDVFIQHIHFTEGTLNGRPIVLAQTGIGKVNAAITTTLLLEHFQPKFLLFTGIAGGINPNLLPGDLVIGDKVAYHDYGTITDDSMVLRPTRNPNSMVENPIYFICDTALLHLAKTVGKTVVFEKIKMADGSRSPQIITGTIVTGDVFVSSTVAVQRLRKQMNADATEMEGAAVAQTCYQQKVPFLVIRSLSDNANGHASGDVAMFYKIAAENSAKLVDAILGKLGK